MQHTLLHLHLHTHAPGFVRGRAVGVAADQGPAPDLRLDRLLRARPRATRLYGIQRRGRRQLRRPSRGNARPCSALLRLPPPPRPAPCCVTLLCRTEAAAFAFFSFVFVDILFFFFMHVYFSVCVLAGWTLACLGRWLLLTPPSCFALTLHSCCSCVRAPVCPRCCFLRLPCLLLACPACLLACLALLCFCFCCCAFVGWLVCWFVF